MPTFEIEQYEICTTKYQIEAANEAEAIAKMLSGGAEVVDDSHELIEVADKWGLPAVEHRKLVRDLRKLGVKVQKTIPSIRAIEQID